MANIVEIRDLDAPEIAAYARLTEARLRAEDGLMIAESEKVIRAALDAGCRPVSMLMERRHIEGKAAGLIAEHPEITVYTASDEALAALTGFRLTRGILCAMERPKPLSAEDICEDARRVAVLEGVRDATNVGAIFRAAAALGMDAVLLTTDCCDPLNRRALRVGMGTPLMIPWARLEAGWLPRLRRSGFFTAALALTENSLPVDDARLREAERLALLLGSEGDGLRPETIAGCDAAVKIPMAHGVDSLNVAAAAAVAFWAVRA